MAGRLLLVGGDEFRPGCEEMDATVLRATGKSRPSVVILPTAAASERPQRAADNGVRHFESLGGDARALMALDDVSADDPMIADEVETADVVYFTGGNPTHLMLTLQDSLLLEAVRIALDNGAILAGSSAGAMVLGSWMRLREWRRALGIVYGIAVLPHHEQANPNTVVTEIMPGVGDSLRTVLGIDGQSGAFGGPDRWTVIGSGHVTTYQDDRWRRYEPGERFSTG